MSLKESDPSISNYFEGPEVLYVCISLDHFFGERGSSNVQTREDHGSSTRKNGEFNSLSFVQATGDGQLLETKTDARVQNC